MKTPALLALLFVFTAVAGEPAVPLDGNEQAAVGACKMFAEAEDIYRRTDYDRDGVLEYAQTLCGGKRVEQVPLEPAALPQPADDEKKKIDAAIAALGSDEFSVREKASGELAAIGAKAVAQLQISAKTSRDAETVNRCNRLLADISEKLSPARPAKLAFGLLQTAAGNADIALVDRQFAAAECFSDEDPAHHAAYHGYLFRVLTRQGAAAAGGSRSYLSNGRMTLGYALVAFPQEYGKTGRKVFEISNAGVIYEKDFASREATEAFVKTCTEYNPDNTWVVSE
jgi:hypothetical protein